MSYRIACLGDSITEGIGDSEGIGWPGRIASLFKEEYANVECPRFMNLGVAGDTSSDLYHRLLNEVGYRRPDKLIIFGGTNDIAHRLWPDCKGTERLPTRSR